MKFLPFGEINKRIMNNKAGTASNTNLGGMVSVTV